MKRPSLSIVVPVYNSAATLAELVERLHAAVSPIAEQFEIILVNDGSKDASWEAIARLARTWPAVRGVDLARNFGQHNALLCGIRLARHEWIVTLDDDLQHPPEEIPRLLEAITDDVDVVYGPPRAEQHGWWRDGASILTKMALRHLLGAATAQRACAFRAFRTGLREAFDDFRCPFVSIDVLLTWATSRFASTPTRHEPRRVGRSNYNLRKLVSHAWNLTTGFSTAPLRMAGMVGFATMLFGALVLAVVVVRFVIDGSPAPGFPFLASIITIFSGAQLFAIGIIGEYLARMYFRVIECPPYAIRRQTGPLETPLAKSA